MSKAVVPAQSQLPALTPDDRLLLQELMFQGSVKKTAQALGVTPQQVRNRMKKPEVAAAFDDGIGTKTVESAKRELNLITGSIGDILEEAKDAHITKQEIATCPQCHQTFVINVQNIAWATKLKAAELLMRFTKMLNNNTKVEFDANVTTRNFNVTFTTPQALAMDALQRGEPVPRHIYSELEDLAQQGNFTLPPNPSDIADGNYRVLEEDTHADDSDE